MHKPNIDLQTFRKKMFYRFIKFPYLRLLYLLLLKTNIGLKFHFRMQSKVLYLWFTRSFDVFSATVSHTVLSIMYARQRTGLVNRYIRERNVSVNKKKFALHKCCETFAFKYT